MKVKPIISVCCLLPPLQLGFHCVYVNTRVLLDDRSAFGQFQPNGHSVCGNMIGMKITSLFPGDCVDGCARREERWMKWQFQQQQWKFYLINSMLMKQDGQHKDLLLPRDRRVYRPVTTHSWSVFCIPWSTVDGNWWRLHNACLNTLHLFCIMKINSITFTCELPPTSRAGMLPDVLFLWLHLKQ